MSCCMQQAIAWPSWRPVQAKPQARLKL